MSYLFYRKHIDTVVQRFAFQLHVHRANILVNPSFTPKNCNKKYFVYGNYVLGLKLSRRCNASVTSVAIW